MPFLQEAIGHLAKVCKSRVRQSQSTPQATATSMKKPYKPGGKRTHHISGAEKSTGDKETYALFHVSGKTNQITIVVEVDSRDLVMEVDTRASATLMSNDTYHSFWPENKPPLEPSTTRLKTYTRENLSASRYNRSNIRTKLMS